ncbi:hypothetical protein BBJ29_000386 [Phytophthora kernoviae]|uniref:Pre-mRNA-splicing factor SYF2 n=1 Tax=Phytophthora kernoviae TaxID=325452 RepID=A0A3F2S130_9STRA|nr:hypothetical protein BBJ29_000386 [Phytophthora kernoviae]RLN67328.1 hypothetical protein BBP00_00001714 [Phytophthora kernoviae]
MVDTEQDQDQLTAMTPAQKKLFELRMKMNAGRKANKQEVAAEHDRVKNNDKKARKEEQYQKREEKKTVAASGKTHLNETAEVAESKSKKANKKDKRKAAFGWDVFNQDSLYKGYKKRLVHLPTAGESEKTGTVSGEDALGDELSYGKGDNLDEENVERMAQELEERIKARKRFSRRRQHVEGEDVDYINGQNRIFNRKASQAFDKYTVEIRQNLERGTAL